MTQVQLVRAFCKIPSLVGKLIVAICYCDKFCEWWIKLRALNRRIPSVSFDQVVSSIYRNYHKIREDDDDKIFIA